MDVDCVDFPDTCDSQLVSNFYYAEIVRAARDLAYVAGDAALGQRYTAVRALGRAMCRSRGPDAGRRGPAPAARCPTQLLDTDIVPAFNARFRVRAPHLYFNGKQCSLAMAIWLNATGADTERTQLALLDDVMTTRRGHLTTGIAGTKYVLQVLEDMGRCDAVTHVLASDEYPSFGYMARIRNTSTLWETWTGSQEFTPASFNHIMYGSYAAQLIGCVAGLRRAGVGYARVRVWPALAALPAGTRSVPTRAVGSIETPRGTVSVAWAVDAATRQVAVNVSVPPNADADICVPVGHLSGAVVVERDRVVWADGRFRPGVPGLRAATLTLMPDRTLAVVLDAGSGEYAFRALATDEPQLVVANVTDEPQTLRCAGAGAAADDDIAVNNGIHIIGAIVEAHATYCNVPLASARHRVQRACLGRPSCTLSAATASWWPPAALADAGGDADCAAHPPQLRVSALCVRIQ